MAKCARCTVGPGKFEGEGALTALAYWHRNNGTADETVGTSDFFRSPLQFDADSEAVEFARSVGFCAECIDAANDEARELGGASIREDDVGFVYLTTYASRDEYEAAIDEANADECADEYDGGEEA